MPSKSARLRNKAYSQQLGRCWYCKVPMWLHSPAELSCAPSMRAAADLRCTAEHLVARCDGGLDVESNIVAACFKCNRTRHLRKRPPDPVRYRESVRLRVERGSWHNAWVLASGLLQEHSGNVKAGHPSSRVTVLGPNAGHPAKRRNAPLARSLR